MGVSYIAQPNCEQFLALCISGAASATSSLPDVDDDERLAVRLPEPTVHHGIDYSHNVNVTQMMRLQLVDWLLAVAHELQLPNTAFQQSVCYLDCYLSFHRVKRHRFQCLGISCLYMAGKAVSPGSLTLSMASFLSDGDAPEEDILWFESSLNKAFLLKTPPRTLAHHLADFLSRGPSDAISREMCNYLSHVALMDKDLCAEDMGAVGQTIREVTEVICTSRSNGGTSVWSASTTSEPRLERKLIFAATAAADSGEYIQEIYPEAFLIFGCYGAWMLSTQDLRSN